MQSRDGGDRLALRLMAVMVVSRLVEMIYPLTWSVFVDVFVFGKKRAATGALHRRRLSHQSS